MSSKSNPYGYDFIGKILQHLMSNIPGTGIKELKPMTESWQDQGIFTKFLQAEFVPKNSGAINGM